MHALALVALLGQLNCCVQGFEMITELEFDGGALVERLVIRGPPPCGPPRARTRAQLDALLDTFDERYGGGRWAHTPLIRVRGNFHAELRRSADSL